MATIRVKTAHIKNWDAMKADGWRVSSRARWKISAKHPSGAEFDLCRFGDDLQASLSMHKGPFPSMTCNARVSRGGRDTHEWANIARAMPKFTGGQFHAEYAMGI